MNPRPGRARRAIEVYPHPATVALFRLGRTLKYKNKPGRDLEQLRGELLVLMGLLEGLADADAAAAWSRADRRWLGAAQRAVETADRARASCGWSRTRSTPCVCAYVALFASPRAGADHDVRRLRDRLHRHARPCPRATARRPASRAGRRRAPSRTRSAPRSASTPRGTPALRAAGEQFVALVTTILDDAGINYLSVTGRAKSVASFAAKAARTVDGVPGLHRPAARDHRPDRRPRDHLRAQRRGGRRRPARRPGGRARRPRHGPGDRERGPVRLRQPAPAGRPRRGARGPAGVRAAARATARRCRSAPCCSTRGRSSSTTSATRARSPTSTRRDFDRRFTLAAGLLELADREFSTIRDRLQAGDARATPPAPAGRRPADQPARAGGVPRRAVRRRRLVAHRPLRLDLRAAARARHHLARRARRRAARRSTTAADQRRGWTTATRPAPYAASTTRCWRPSASGTSRCTATPTARPPCAPASRRSFPHLTDPSRVDRIRGLFACC